MSFKLKLLVPVIVACAVFVVVAINTFTNKPQVKTDANNSDRDFSTALSTDGPSVIEGFDQRKGDAVAGLQALLNEDYVSCGMPERVHQALVELPNNYRHENRSGAGADLPFFNNRVTDRYGNTVITNNCFSCHATKLFGSTVLGLGNEFLNFTEDASRAVVQAGRLIRGPQETQSWSLLADRIAAIAPYTVASTAGVNVANNLTFALMTHLDPVTLAWSDTPLMQPPDVEPLPVSVPPWWRMRYKASMFYQGQWQGDHARTMIMAAMLCTDGTEILEEADEYAADIRAYIASIEPPKYPFEIDSELAEAGKSVFESNCSGCHGRYGDKPGYPNLVVPLTIIGTDPDLAVQAADDYRRFARWFEKSWFYRDASLKTNRGYVPPPLHGVWATSPYLHNGSVPTILALLDSTTRPVAWQYQVLAEPTGADSESTRKTTAAKFANIPTDPANYDQQGLGWRVVEADFGSDAFIKGELSQWWYDSRRRGHGIQGHTFGDALTQEERIAVIEYLKML